LADIFKVDRQSRYKGDYQKKMVKEWKYVIELKGKVVMSFGSKETLENDHC
jgi:stalled ribosome alternative rescue factor ArfA